MAIYKPSNLGPNLKEIDVTLREGEDNWQANIFEAQVNTTGENVLAYRLNILENNTNETIYESDGIELPRKPTNYFGKDGVKNKDFVKTYYDSKEIYTSNRNFIINTINCPKLKNGKDYQWNIRMYDAPLRSDTQPITKVCDGFLVGSTHYVIWVNKPTQNVNDLLLYDRYVEFEPKSGSQGNVFPIIEQDSDITWPPTEKERIQIDWVEKELGNNKDITKIELVDSLKYNYKNGATFNIFLCDDKHTLNSAYADPNSAIEVSCFMARYGSRPSTVPVKYTTLPTDNASSTTTGLKDFRRIIGTSTVTGEMRVQEPFISLPVNGDYYVLYSLDRVNNEYKIIDGQGSYSAGATNASITSSTKAFNQRIGGNSQGSATVMNNVWDNSTKRLFIQPNINIKSDKDNPNEIVFDVNGVRVDILQVIKNNKDWTFNKLDNTQWLLENESGETRLSAVTSIGDPITESTSTINAPTATTKQVPIIPGSIYTVYTDFMDSMPNGVFYARKTPVITMKFHNMNSEGGPTEEYEIIQDNESRPWRDIEFKADWESVNNTQVKYYRYILYDGNGNKIAESQDLYDNDLYWSFRGFRTDDKEPETTPVNYSIELLIVDELNKEFIKKQSFKVLYTTVRAEAPLEVEYDCDKQAFKVTAESPLYAIQSNTEEYKQVGLESVNAKKGIVDIPINRVMNYNKVLSLNYPNITLTKPLYYLTQFKLNKEFVRAIPAGGERIITEIACQKDPNNVELGYDKYTLKISSMVNYFIDKTNNIIIKNNDKLKMKWYKNDESEPLKCFNNGESDNFDVIYEDPDQTEQGESGSLAYALQASSTSNIDVLPEDVDINKKWAYVVADSFPSSIRTTQKLFLTQDYVFNGILYKKGGIYTYSASYPNKWRQEPSKEFLFVESLDQLPGYNFNQFAVPLNCRDEDGKTINYKDIDTVWLDDLNEASDYMENILVNKWFMLMLKIDEDNFGNEVVRSQISINRERV